MFKTGKTSYREKNKAKYTCKQKRLTDIDYQRNSFRKHFKQKLNNIM